MSRKRSDALLILLVSCAPLAFSLWLSRIPVGREPEKTEKTEDAPDEYTE